MRDPAAWVNSHYIGSKKTLATPRQYDLLFLCGWQVGGAHSGFSRIVFKLGTTREIEQNQSQLIGNGCEVAALISIAIAADRRVSTRHQWSNHFDMVFRPDGPTQRLPRYRNQPAEGTPGISGSTKLGRLGSFATVPNHTTYGLDLPICVGKDNIAWPSQSKVFICLVVAAIRTCLRAPHVSAIQLCPVRLLVVHPLIGHFPLRVQPDTSYQRETTRPLTHRLAHGEIEA